MKKTILPVILCVAIASFNAQAADGGKMEGGSPAKKSTAMVRNIVSDKLPSKLLKTIKSNYKSYWITGLYKEDVNGKVSYHITIENPDQVVTMSAPNSANWSVEKIVAKS